MNPAELALMTVLQLAELVARLLRAGEHQRALDAAEALAHRIAFEEAQRRKASIWARMFGAKR